MVQQVRGGFRILFDKGETKEPMITFWMASAGDSVDNVDHAQVQMISHLSSGDALVLGGKLPGGRWSRKNSPKVSNTQEFDLKYLTCIALRTGDRPYRHARPPRKYIDLLRE